jgi:hypothetical protein
LRAGGCTIHKSRTFHYTSGNNTDFPRRAYTLGFEVKPNEDKSGRLFYWNTAKETEREKRRDNSGAHVSYGDPGK